MYSLHTRHLLRLGEHLSAGLLREVVMDAQSRMSQCRVCKVKAWNNLLRLLPFSSSLVWKGFAQNISMQLQRAIQIPKRRLMATL